MTVTTSLAIRSITLPTGVTLQYTEQGNLDGTPVVFLHGYSDSLVSFSLAMPYLPPSVRAIALSQRGHGDSSEPVAGYSMEDFAADVVAVLDALGIERAVIAGHSLGSVVATRVAADYPKRVLGVVLIAAFYDPFASRADMLEMNEAVQSFTDPVDEGFVREFQVSTVAQPVPAEFIDSIVQESLKLSASVWKSVFAGLLADDRSSQFGAITAPALILWGDQDLYALDEEQQSMLAALANTDARLDIYEGTGHSIQWEQPERFARDVASFVDSVLR